MSKRKREFLLGDEPPDLEIKVADKEVSIQAHSEVLRLFSEIVREVTVISGSPGAWDLRNVILEGESQPVKGATVGLWLDCLYSCVDSSRRFKLPSKLSEAKSLLLFACYAGTVEIPLSKIARALCDDPQLSLTVPVGDQGRSVDLLLRGRIYYCGGDLYQVDVPQGDASVILPSVDFQPHRQQFASALSSLLEEWLELACRLGLVPLVERLLEFVRRLLFPGDYSVVQSCVASIFSPRVLQAMPKQLLLEGFLSHNLGCRPSDAVLDTSDVKLSRESPEVRAWMGSLTDKAASLKPSATGDCQSSLKVETTNLFCNVLVGGLPLEESTRTVKEALAKVLEEQ